MAALLETALHYLENVYFLLNRMQSKRATSKRKQVLVMRFNIRRWWQKLLFMLQPNAILLKHSQRVTIVAVVGFMLYYGLELPRGYWIVLTIMVLLQPISAPPKKKPRTGCWEPWQA
jgi:uncharacterized membrane protein YccC